MIGLNGSREIIAMAMLMVVFSTIVDGEKVVGPPKDCDDAVNKTCITAELATTKNIINKTMVTNTTIGVIHQYDVMPGNYYNESALKEIVLIDQITPRPNVSTVVTVTNVGDKKTNRTSENSKNNVTFVAGTSKSTVVKAGTKANASTMATETILKRTDNTTNVAATTSNITTNTSDTTTATTTTTTVVTTTVSITTVPNVISNAVHFVPNKYCYCDLIDGSCDMNCCCDVDCTNHDLKLFTLCSDQTHTNLIKPESILFDSSLFYVVVDNVPSDYFYPERESIESEPQVVASLRNRNVFNWHYDEKNSRLLRSVNSAHNSYDLTYNSLRWMYFIVSNAKSSEIKAFSLKNSAFNSLCNVDQPVEYLTEKETNCQIYIPNLMDICNNGSSLNFEHYYSEKGLFKVVQPINSNAQKTEKIGLITIQAVSHHRCVSVDGASYDCRVRKVGGNDDPQPYYNPVYSDGVCRRVVDMVEYRLTHNGTQGVRRVDVHFRHRDVVDIGRPIFLAQRHTVRFVRVAVDGAAAADVFARSGKPGYAVGSSVILAAVTVLGAKDAAKPYRPRPMDLPEPDTYGTCGGASYSTNVTGRRRSVNFLENVDVQCRIRIRRPRRLFKRADEWSIADGMTMTEFCHGIQNETIWALGDYEGTLVASLGDPDVAKWIPVVVIKPASQPPASSPPSPEDMSCPAIIDKMHLRVLYAHVGTFENPQTTILGVLVNYTASTVAVVIDNNNASFQYVMAEIPIRASVVFVDLTRPPVRTFAEPPTYEFRLPEDFYYPFWSSDNGGHVAISAASSHFYFKFIFSFPLILITLWCLYLSRVSIIDILI